MSGADFQGSGWRMLGNVINIYETRIVCNLFIFQAWLVMFCSFLTNGLIFGTINTFGVIFVFLKSELDEKVEEGVESEATNSAGKAALVGAMAVGATFALSPVSGILADKYGLRLIAFIGGLIATLGMFLSSFFVHNVSQVYRFKSNQFIMSL